MDALTELQHALGSLKLYTNTIRFFVKCAKRSPEINYTDEFAKSADEIDQAGSRAAFAAAKVIEEVTAWQALRHANLQQRINALDPLN